jgi:D-3-phosphoglycerate dehydrogenase
MQKILIATSSFGKHDKLPLRMIEKKGYQPVLNPYSRKLDSKEVSELIETHRPVGIIAGVEPLNAESLEAASELLVISRCGIGMDNVDLAFAQKMNIKVSNTPDGPTQSVAELTLGLILALSRQICVSDASIRKGQWRRPMGNLLQSKVVAVIGCGRIGSQLIRLLKPFNCDIKGVDPVAPESGLWNKASLDEALSKANVITLHLPYSSENHHFINQAKLEMMNPDAILINASRGGLVDEKALYDALVKNKIKGAALDCFELEPYEGPLTELDNVLLTGHIGSYAVEGRITMEIKAVENLLTHLKSE